MALPSSIWQRGNRASQPAATDVAAGTIYYVTDELVTERSTGTAWEDVSDAGVGGGDFSGPASATDNAIVRFDGTTGKLGQNSAVTIADTTGLIAGARFANTGLNIEDTDASHLLNLKPGSNISANRTLTFTTGDADRTLTLTGDATVNQDTSTAGNPAFASVTVANTGLHVLDTNASHDLILVPGSDLSADRNLTITTGDAARSITLPILGVVGISIDGGGSAIATGTKGYVTVPYAGTIVSATLLADISTTTVMDVWKDTYANYPPTIADTITASAKPTITTALKSQDTTLTGWTTSVAAGDTFGFTVDSNDNATFLHLSLKIERT